MTEREFKKLYEKEIDVVGGVVSISTKAIHLPPPYYDLDENGEKLEVSRERFLEIMLEVVAGALSDGVGHIFNKRSTQA